MLLTKFVIKISILWLVLCDLHFLVNKERTSNDIIAGNGRVLKNAYYVVIFVKKISWNNFRNWYCLYWFTLLCWLRIELKNVLKVLNDLLK